MPHGSALDYIRRMKRRDDNDKGGTTKTRPYLKAQTSALLINDRRFDLGFVPLYDRCRQLDTEFKFCKEELPRLCKTLGLPRIDIDLLVMPHLTSTSTTEVPHLTSLMATMQRHDLITETTMSHITQRERLMREVRASCVCNNSVACSQEAHMILFQCVNEIDTITTHVMRCILQWRGSLNRPLPFPYQGDNYIFRIVDDAPLMKRVVFHLSTQSRALQGKMTVPSTKWGQAKLHTFHTVGEWGRDVPEEVKLASQEYESQLGWIAKSLELAGRGLYVPVLGFHGARPVFVESHRRKHELLAMYTHALTILQQKGNGGLERVDLDFRALAKEFASCNHRLGFAHYWNVWYQFATNRSQNRAATNQLLATVLIAHMRIRFEVWRTVTVIRVSQKAETLQKKILGSKVLFKRYLKKWYYYRCLRSMALAGRTLLLRRYYNSLVFIRNRRIASFTDPNIRYMWVVASSTLSVPLQHLHDMIKFQKVHRPRFEINQAEEFQRLQLFSKFCFDIANVMNSFMSEKHVRSLSEVCVELERLHYEKLIAAEAVSHRGLEAEYEMVKNYAGLGW